MRIAWVAGGVIVVWLGVWFWQLFAVPGNYVPSEPIGGSEISLYLTNRLGPELHNKAQYEQPFELVIAEYGVGDIISRWFGRQQFDGLTFQNVCVAFEPEGVYLMGRCEYRGFRFVGTVVMEPGIDENGDFFLDIRKIKVGRSRLPFAAMIFRKKMAGKLEKAAGEKIFGDVAELLLNNGAVKPVMKVGGFKIRVEKIETVRDKMIISFVPEK